MPLGIATRSFLNDPHCGDQAACWRSGSRTTLCIVDGLGHGPEAEAAAQAAVDYVAQRLSESLLAIFAGCDLALRNSRGAAMGLAAIAEETGTLTYAGVGNTRAIIIRGIAPAGREARPFAQIVRLSSYPGIVGGGYQALVPQTVPFLPGNIALLFTDGLPESMDLAGYGPDVWSNEQHLAERIVRDWGRETDDVAVLVYRRKLNK
ncbi:MAG: SpoIIE family protein phosphatase [Anaerolineae bacterium]